ncbi:cell division protein FtsQ/DivIB [Thioclava sp. FR2]|uniref:cell division protein FtsQ/DivIB n=1 Tax=Thioclava sp. FR2 TaxID=3445780 RepID=UPI003EB6BB64
MQRLWLTPLFRVAFRFGLPTLGLAAAVAIVVADADRRAAVTNAIADIRERFENRPEFMVGLVSVDGASPELADAVRARLDLKLPLSSFDIDLTAAQQRIQELDAVARADLMVRSGGLLKVRITERKPVVLWRTDLGVEMLDETGHRVASLSSRSDRPDLPLIAGEGADAATPEALALIAAAEPLHSRLRGLIRVGDRRWDLVLDRNQRILLPSENPIAAVERLIALDKANDLMGRDILTVDLRNEHRPVLRLTPYALNQRRQAQGFDISGSEL